MNEQDKKMIEINDKSKVENRKPCLQIDHAR
jgi:hypothetical protein